MNFNKVILSKEEKEKRQKELRKQFEKDQEPVKGIFHFHEVPGGKLDFTYKKYKWQSIESYSMVDGQMYTIPRGVARHLNSGTSYPVHSNILDASGAPIVAVSERKKRTSFQSMDFVDAESDDKKVSTTIPVIHGPASEAPSALTKVQG